VTEGYVIELVRHLVYMVCLLAGPILVCGLIVGLLMGVVQAATQIQENSLSFLPKMVIAGLAVTFGGPWALGQLVTYAGQMLLEVVTLAPRGMG
jgi:flagellar biosynthetic protein FliQ